MKISSKFLGITAIFGALVLVTVPNVLANGQNIQDTYTTLYQQQSSNVYKADEDVVITENISGDLVVAGGTVEVKANVAGDVLVAGGAVQIDGNVTGDVTAAGGYIVINGDVAGDVRAFGGEVYVNSKVVTGDLLVAAGSTQLAKGLSVSGAEMIPNKEDLKRDVESPTKDISQYKPMFKQSRIEYGNNKDDGKMKSGMIVTGLIFQTIILVGTIIAGYAILRLFPVISETGMVTMQKSPFVAIAVGVATYFLGFIGAIALAISVIGWNLLYVLFVLGLVSMMLGNVLATYMVGRLILKKLKRVDTGRLQPLVLGTIVIVIGTMLLGVIPFIGNFLVFIISTGLSCWAVGALVMNKWNAVMGEKKK
jgi:hypothetical protein